MKSKKGLWLSWIFYSRKIDKAIALHQKNIDEADIFMASVLNDVFVELNTNETIELKYITSKIGSGSTQEAVKKHIKMKEFL